MEEQKLIEFLKTIDIGAKIPGTVKGKFYFFNGLKKYSGKGRYPNLKGVEVIELHSDERKRPILLFLEPLLLLVNSDPQKLLFGQLPTQYIKKYRSGDIQGIPNLFEYETHYKSIARYIHDRSKEKADSLGG